MKPSTEPSSGNGSPSLVERLEAATEGTLELSALAVTDAGKLRPGWVRVEYQPSDGTPVARHSDEAGDFEEFDDVTRSLDAALTLVPEGWELFIESGRGEWWATLKQAASPYRVCVSPEMVGKSTPALALCIAALKARLGDVG